MKRIILLTSRYGGPYTWGKGLKSALTKKGFQVDHRHTIKDFIKTLFSSQGDIIHTTVPLPFVITKKPVVATIHGEYKREKFVFRYFYERLLKRAKVITAPSQFIKAYVKKKEVIVIPNAINPLSLSQKPEPYNVLTIMNFDFEDKVKGILQIVSILEKSKYAKNITYYVLGQGKYLNTIKEQTKKSSIRIVYCGHTDIRPYLEKAQLFLYYSHHDNFPMVILESLSAGVPVITNNVGAVKEIFTSGKEGYIESSHSAYLKRVDALLDDSSLRKKLSGAGKELVKKKFTWDVLVDKYIQIYQRL